MVKSEQEIELGEQGFKQLKDELSVVPTDRLPDFQTDVHPDSMGFYGKEGVDDDNQ